jgi:hypothetical protein
MKVKSKLVSVASVVFLASSGILYSCKDSGDLNIGNPATQVSTKQDLSQVSAEGTRLVADGPGNTYELINSVLGGTAYEVPDCAHTSFGRHITEAFDSQLNKNVFLFYIHPTPDNDRCQATDRQRNEIKTYGPSPSNLKASNGETVTYRWKFKLDTYFQPSPSFTHIHQIKAGDGDDAAPLITLTPRYNSAGDQMQLIHINSSGTQSTKNTVSLAGFKGAWVDVVEKIKYGSAGTYSITIKKISDGSTLMSWSTSSLDLWRSGTTFCRPKWGIYRSLNNSSYLRTEVVRFADFCIAEGSNTCSL